MEDFLNSNQSLNPFQKFEKFTEILYVKTNSKYLDKSAILLDSVIHWSIY